MADLADTQEVLSQQGMAYGSKSVTVKLSKVMCVACTCEAHAFGIVIPQVTWTVCRTHYMRLPGCNTTPIHCSLNCNQHFALPPSSVTHAPPPPPPATYAQTRQTAEHQAQMKQHQSERRKLGRSAKALLTKKRGPVYWRGRRVK